MTHVNRWVLVFIVTVFGSGFTGTSMLRYFQGVGQTKIRKRSGRAETVAIMIGLRGFDFISVSGGLKE